MSEDILGHFFYLKTIFSTSLNKEPMGCEAQLAAQLYNFKKI